MIGRKKTAGYYLLNLFSVILAVFFLLPIVWALFVSLQTEGQQIKTVFDWFKPPYTFENYPQIMFNTSVPLWFKNSLIIAIVTTGSTIICSSMAAYAIAKIPFKGNNIFFLYFLLGMLVPGEATIVPLFITANNLKMINTLPGMILPAVAGSMNLIIMVNFFKALPNEIIESVRIDGGGELSIFCRIVLPLSKPIIATVCIFSFVGSWNNYLWPLLCAMKNEMFTLPIGIPTFVSTYTVDYVVPMTAAMVASLPMIIMYILFERQIVAGMMTGAVKG